MNEEQEQDLLKSERRRYILRILAIARGHNWKTHDGMSLLGVYARFSTDQDIFLALLQNGCREEYIDNQGNDLIMHMLNRHRFDVANELFDKGMYDWTRKNHYGHTIMVMVITYPPLLQKFIIAGAPVNIVSFDGHSLLWYALYRAEKESALSLLAAGATLSTTKDETFKSIYSVFFMNLNAWEVLLITLLVLNCHPNSLELLNTMPLAHRQLVEEGPSLAQRCWFVHEIAKRRVILNCLKENYKELKGE